MEGIINFHNHIMFFLTAIGVFVFWLLGRCLVLYNAETNTDKIESHNNLLENIQNIKSFVPCNEASFRFLGLSLAGYNFISSLIMSIYTFLFLRNENE